MENLTYEKLRDMSLKTVIGEMKLTGIRWEGQMEMIGREEKCMQRFGGETRRKYTAFKMRLTGEDNVKVYLEETG